MSLTHLCLVCWNTAEGAPGKCSYCGRSNNQTEWRVLPWSLPNHDHLKLRQFYDRGGQGAIFRATDEHLGKEVAVKLIARNLNNAQYEREITRFENEKAAMDFVFRAARLPLFANVYDFHPGSRTPKLDQAPAFLEMELIEWPTLAKLLRQHRRLSPKRVFRLGLELAQALRSMSSCRIIHNDIKPSNLFAKIDNDSVQLKIADFGAWTPDDGKITQVGSLGDIAITVAYMSPEQSSGKSWDKRSDIYAACCVLWQCSAGRRPFQDIPPSLPLLEQIAERRRITQKVPDRPPVMPPELFAVLVRGLQHAAEDRHQNADELRSELQDAFRSWAKRIEQKRIHTIAELETLAADAAELRRILSPFRGAHDQLSVLAPKVEMSIGSLRERTDEQHGVDDCIDIDIDDVRAAIDNSKQLLTGIDQSKKRLMVSASGAALTSASVDNEVLDVDMSPGASSF